jgi:hypothetical protein
VAGGRLVIVILDQLVVGLATLSETGQHGRQAGRRDRLTRPVIAAGVPGMMPGMMRVLAGLNGRLVMVALAVLLVCLLGPSRPAAACSCAPAPPLADAVSVSDLIFEGVAQGFQPSSQPITGFIQGSSVPSIRVQFEVKQRWKGDATATLGLLTPESCASCGRDFTTGTTYLVYARRQSDGAFFDLLCSRTRPLASASEDLTALGAGMPPLPGSGPPPATPAGGCAVLGRSGSTGAPGWLVIAILALACLAARRDAPDAMMSNGDRRKQRVSRP